MGKQSMIGRVVSASSASALVLGVALATAQSNSVPERFTSFAVNLGSPGRAAAGTVEIVINRWSTDSERDRLLSVLLEKGPERLLDALQDAPRAGYIRTPNRIGHDLRFARRIAGDDGGERIILATDRPIRFWEAFYQPRSIDYPFTVIELRIDRNGEGEGKMSLATKITADNDNKPIVLEDYATQPVLLQHVRRESVSSP